MRKRYVKLLILIATLQSIAWGLPASIDRFIAKSGIPKKDISIYIKETKSDRVVASLYADRSRTPASVIKVLTTYAAITKLGFNWRWSTKYIHTGKLRRGTLYGDLLIKGYGDPTLKTTALKSIVSHIKKRGIKQINGNIVIDRSYFSVGNKNNSGFDNNRYSAYNAMPDAMMFNERISTVNINPKKNLVYKRLKDDSYKLNNRLKRVNRPCRGKYSYPSLSINHRNHTTVMTIGGTISKRCGARSVSKVITKPYKSFYYALKDLLNRSGVRVKGRLKLAKIPSNAKLIYTHRSKKLEKIVSKTAKKSNNLYARHLLLLLGAKQYGAPATLAKGSKAVKRVLSNIGALPSAPLKIDNGCGLSRSAKLNAKVLARVCDSAYRRYGKRWMNTLSIAGVDGTINRRFRGTVAKGRAWMKTGTLNRVKNITGYVKSKSGKLYTVVILVNTNKPRWKASQLQNQIIKWLVRYKPSRGVHQPKKPNIQKLYQKKIESSIEYSRPKDSFNPQDDIVEMPLF